jgi:hypothetical protein
MFALVVLGIVALAIVHRVITGRDDAGRYFTICAFAALLQIVTVLIVFSYSNNREIRYLLPLLPAAALVVCWSVAHFGSSLLTGLAVIAFAGQLVLMWGGTFGLFSVDPHIVLRRIDAGGHNLRLLEAIVAHTCYDTAPQPYANTIAIDPAFRGDWLAPEPANYVAARDAIRNAKGPSCVYGYAGGGFLGERADTAWDDLVSQNIRYIVTVDPRIHTVPAKTYNRALDEKHFPILWSHLEQSSLFSAEPPLPEDPGIRIFRRMDPR